MTQLVGASRISNSMANIDIGDERLAAQLALYKTPATIRDMRQVFFYLQLNADTTTLNPITLFTNKNLTFSTPPPTVNPYYLPIGTRRPFLVGERVNELIDLRVPKDKYVVEINLIEAQIEANTRNWTNIVELIEVDTAGVITFDNVYKLNYEYVIAPVSIPSKAISPVPATPPFEEFFDPVSDVPIRNLYLTSIDQTFKKSVPQSLFCRIRGMENSQPYNWSVTNTGEVSQDKSHLLLIRHGDVNYSDLELEFGHLVFRGADNEYARYIDQDILNRNILPGDPQRAPYESAAQSQAAAVLGQKKEYRNFDYLDYNWEWDNELISGAITKSDYIYPAKRAVGEKQTINVKPLFDKDGAPVGVVPTLRDVYISRDPLKYNQQVSNIYFRFMIRIVHLF
jgi:hypothetical protein